MPAQVRRAILTLWLWQAEECADDDACSLAAASQAGMYREALHWGGDARRAGPLSRLRGRSLVARYGELTLGVINVHYELDKSSLR